MARLTSFAYSRYSRYSRYSLIRVIRAFESIRAFALFARSRYSRVRVFAVGVTEWIDFLHTTPRRPLLAASPARALAQTTRTVSIDVSTASSSRDVVSIARDDRIDVPRERFGTRRRDRPIRANLR